MLLEVGSAPLTQPTRAIDLLKRPRVRAGDLLALSGASPRADIAMEVLGAVEVELKYSGYVIRERERADRLRQQANFVLDKDLPYDDFEMMSFEAREKLSRVRPGTLAQAGRIPGVSPSDLQNLILEVRRYRASVIGDRS